MWVFLIETVRERIIRQGLCETQSILEPFGRNKAVIHNSAWNKKKSIFFLNCKTSAMHVGTKRMEYTCTITIDPCSIFAGSRRVLNWNLKKLTNNQIWTKIPKREIFIFTWIFKKYQAIYLNFSLFITITFFCTYMYASVSVMHFQDLSDVLLKPNPL